MPWLQKWSWLATGRLALYGYADGDGDYADGDGDYADGEDLAAATASGSCFKVECMR